MSPAEPPASAGHPEGENTIFRTFWSLDPGWGEFLLESNQVELRLLSGELDLRIFELAVFAGKAVLTAQLGEEAIPFEQAGGQLRFPTSIHLEPGKDLRIAFES